MNFIRLLKYDIYFGIFRNWKKFLVPILLSFLFSLGVHRSFSYLLKLENIQISAGFYWSALWRGVPEYIYDKITPFALPVDWFLLMFYPLCLLADYAVKDIHATGQYVLLKVCSRKIWWCSKLVWAVLNIVFYYICLLLGVILAGLFTGSASLSLTKEQSAVLLSTQFYQQENFFICFYILPFIVLCLFAVSHLTFSLCISPFYSTIMIVSLQVAGVYYMSPFLPGQYTMFIRNETVVANGVNLHFGLTLNIVLIALLSVCGIMHFERYDILKEKRL